MSANSGSTLCLHQKKKRNQDNLTKINRQHIILIWTIMYLEDGVFGTGIWLSCFCRSKRASTWFWTSMPFLSSGLKTWEINQQIHKINGIYYSTPQKEQNHCKNAAYKSFGLVGTNAVEDHVQWAGQEPALARGTSHRVGLSTASDTIGEEKT